MKRLASRGRQSPDSPNPGANAPGSPGFRQRLSEALERLVQLYDAWGKPEQATEWLEKLEDRKTMHENP